MSLPDYRLSSLRLCVLSDVSLPLGTAVCASWSPSAPHELATLFSSGVLRVWDSLRDVSTDFALFIPCGGSAGGVGPVARRSAAPLASFAFLPASVAGAAAGSESADAAPRGAIAFTVARSRTLAVVAIPPEAADGGGGARGGGDANASGSPSTAWWDDGSRAFEAALPLPAPATALIAWRACAPTRRGGALGVIAAGCADGSIVVWGVGSTLNPQSSAGAAGGRNAAPPRFAHVSTLNGAHGSRIRALAPLVLEPLRSAGVIAGDVPPPHAADTVFCSASDDGKVSLWVVTRAEKKNRANENAWAAGSVDLTIVPFGTVPTDGIRVTSLAAVAWPWAETASARAREPLQSATDKGGRLARAIAAAAATLGDNALPGSTLSNAGARALLATGNAEGVVAAWEITVPARARDLDAHWEPPLGSASLITLTEVPSVRLAAVATAAVDEPILCVSFGAPRRANDAYTLVATAGDGALVLFDVDGARAPSDAAAPLAALAAGGAPPLVLTQKASIEPAGGVASHAHSARAIANSSVRAAAGGDALTSNTVTSALTAAALEALGRVVVAASFNEMVSLAPPAQMTAVAAAVSASGDGALRTADQHRDTDPRGDDELTSPNDEAAAFRVERAFLDGALFAVTGDGAVSLWARDALPGTPPTWPASVVPPLSPADAVDSATNEAFARAAQEAAMDAGVDADDASTGAAGTDDEDGEADGAEAPRAVPPPEPTDVSGCASGGAERAVRRVPHVLLPTVSSHAKAIVPPARGRAAASAAGAGGRDRRSRTPADTRGKTLRALLVDAAQRAVEAAYAQAPRSASVPPSADGVSAAPGSLSSATLPASSAPHAPRPSPVALARALCAPPPAASFLDRDWRAVKFGASGGSAESATVEGTDPGAPPPHSAHDDAGAFEATAAAHDSAGGEVAGLSVHPPGGSPERARGLFAPRPEAPRGGGGAASGQSRPHVLDARFRSPTRLAAALARDAALGARAAGLAAKSLVSAPDAAVDEHATAAIESSLLVPSLGSTAAIALEIARLEGEAFDESAAIARALARRGVVDERVRSALLENAAARRASHESAPTLRPNPAALPRTVTQARALLAASLETDPRATRYDAASLPLAQVDALDRRTTARSRSRSKSLDAPGGRWVQRANGGSPGSEDGADEDDETAAHACDSAPAVTISQRDMLRWSSSLREAGGATSSHAPPRSRTPTASATGIASSITDAQRSVEGFAPSAAAELDALNYYPGNAPPSLVYGSTNSFGGPFGDAARADNERAELGTIVFSPVVRTTPAFHGF